MLPTVTIANTPYFSALANLEIFVRSAANLSTPIKAFAQIHNPFTTKPAPFLLRPLPNVSFSEHVSDKIRVSHLKFVVKLPKIFRNLNYIVHCKCFTVKAIY